MKLRIYLLLSFLCIFTGTINTSEAIYRSINEADLKDETIQFAPQIVRTDGISEKIDLLHDKEGFFVRTKKEDVRIQPYDISKILRNKKTSEILKYAGLGKLKVSQFDDGSYKVDLCGEIKGGGPILAACAAVGVRVLGYSTAATFFFIPGCQCLVLPTCQVTEIWSMYATGAAAVAPTI